MVVVSAKDKYGQLMKSSMGQFRNEEIFQDNRMAYC